jgi:hypothetical protein
VKQLPICVAAAILVAAAACRDNPNTITAPNENPSIDAARVLSVPSEPQRIKWRFKLDGDYSLHSPGVGPDGTVYVSLPNGKLVAVAPTGVQRWTFQAGLGGGVDGPVSVASDGTIYVAGMVPDPGGNGNTGAIFALTPGGTQKWVFKNTGHLIIAGPNIGPDGNIYAVADFGGIGLFSLTPQGQLRWNVPGFSEHGPLGQEISFGPNQLYFAFDMSGTGVQPSTFGYDFNGNQRFRRPDAAQHAQTAVGPNGNVVVPTFPYIGLSLSSYSPAGALLWRFSTFPANTFENPDVGPDNVAYTVFSLSTLYAINPNGMEKWRYRDPGIMFMPRVRPPNDIVFMGGRITYGAPGFFLAVSTGGIPQWRVDLPDEPGFDPYGQLVPMTRPVFSPDFKTAYSVTDVAGDGNVKPYCFLYAIDVAPSGGGGGGNTTPAVHIVPMTSTTISRGSSVSVQGTFVDPDAADGPWTVNWRFGNGQTTQAVATPRTMTRTRTYTTVGTYNIRLRVADAHGALGLSNTITITVH